MTPQRPVHISADFGVSRVIVTGDPMTDAFDVFAQEHVDGKWVERGKFNSLSDDYAYTNAREVAEKIAKRRRA